MSNIPEDLLYTEEDEWLRVDGDEAVIGITDHAQDALSDIVYLELPAVGDSVEAGQVFGVVESVKAASDLFMPISGEILAANDDLVDAPEMVNEDPYGAAWMVRVKIADKSQLEGLMNAAGYKAFLENRE